MSVREFADWMRFEQPLPFELIDIHFGQLLAMLFNVNKTKDTPAARPHDFMVLAKKPEPPQPIGSVAQRMKAIAEGRATE